MSVGDPPFQSKGVSRKRTRFSRRSSVSNGGKFTASGFRPKSGPESDTVDSRHVGGLLHDTGSADHCASMQFVVLFAQLEIDIVDLLVSPAKGFLERREQLDPLKRLCFRSRESRGRNLGGKDIDARRRSGERPNRGFPTCAVWRCDLRAGPSGRAADHVPDDHAVDTLAPTDHLSAQPSVNSRPGIAAWVGSRIGAKAPGDEFVCLGWAFELVCVLTVQTSLQVDDGEAP